MSPRCLQTQAKNKPTLLIMIMQPHACLAVFCSLPRSFKVVCRSHCSQVILYACVLTSVLSINFCQFRVFIYLQLLWYSMYSLDPFVCMMMIIITYCQSQFFLTLLFLRTIFFSKQNLLALCTLNVLVRIADLYYKVLCEPSVMYFHTPN